MWIRFKKTRTLIVAEAWRDFFIAEGINARVVVDKETPGSNATPYGVWVPNTKKDVAEESLRQL